jgi:hypothetical protein
LPEDGSSVRTNQALSRGSILKIGGKARLTEALKQANRLRKAGEAIDPASAKGTSFGEIGLREDKVAYARRESRGHGGKGASNRLHPAVETKLAQGKDGPAGVRKDARLAQDRKGYGEIVSRALFGKVGGGEIDEDTVQGKFEARIADRGAHPLSSLPDRPLGEAHEIHGGDSPAYIHLDMDEKPIEARRLMRGDYHASILRPSTRRRSPAMIQLKSATGE